MPPPAFQICTNGSPAHAGGLKGNWEAFWAAAQRDHCHAALVWNEATRGELREALQVRGAGGCVWGAAVVGGGWGVGASRGAVAMSSSRTWALTTRLFAPWSEIRPSPPRPLPTPPRPLPTPLPLADAIPPRASATTPLAGVRRRRRRRRCAWRACAAPTPLRGWPGTTASSASPTPPSGASAPSCSLLVCCVHMLARGTLALCPAGFCDSRRFFVARLASARANSARRAH